MQHIGLNTDVITSLVDKETSIGLRPVETEGTKNAIAGSQGFAIFPDYRGVRVLSAYKLLDIKGLKWGIMSEIDEEEVFRPIGRLRDHIVNTLITFSLMTLIIGATTGLLFAAYIIRPISRTVKMFEDIAEGRGDLTQRLDSNSGESCYFFRTIIERIFRNQRQHQSAT
jgi:methyl-accepting chemotaxis protein